MRQRLVRWTDRGVGSSRQVSAKLVQLNRNRERALCESERDL